MTASDKNIPKGVDAHDPLLWFNPEAVGAKTAKTDGITPAKKAKTPRTPPKKAKVASKPKFQKSNPSTDLKRKVDGGLQIPLVGNGVYMPSSSGSTGGKGAGIPFTIGDLSRNIDAALASAPERTTMPTAFKRTEEKVNRQVVARHVDGVHYGDRTDGAAKKSPPSRMAGPKKTASVKRPSVELRPSGPGSYRVNSYIRTRDYGLRLIRLDRENS